MTSQRLLLFTKLCIFNKIDLHLIFQLSQEEDNISSSKSQQRQNKDDKQKENLEKQIKDFLSSTTHQTKKKKKLEFPTTLTSRERAWVHEIAEELGSLEHESIGEGNRRHIVIWKKTTSKEDVDQFIKKNKGLKRLLSKK